MGKKEEIAPKVVGPPLPKTPGSSSFHKRNQHMDGSTFYSLRIGFIFLADRKPEKMVSWKSSNIESKSLNPFFLLPFNKVSTCVICEGVCGTFMGGNLPDPQPIILINYEQTFFRRLLLCCGQQSKMCDSLFIFIFFFCDVSYLTLWLLFNIILGISDHLNSWPEWKFAWLLLFAVSLLNSNCCSCSSVWVFQLVWLARTKTTRRRTKSSAYIFLFESTPRTSKPSVSFCCLFALFPAVCCSVYFDFNNVSNTPKMCTQANISRLYGQSHH